MDRDQDGRMVGHSHNDYVTLPDMESEHLWCNVRFLSTLACRRPAGHKGTHGCPGLDRAGYERFLSSDPDLLESIKVTPDELAETLKSLGVEPPMQ